MESFRGPLDLHHWNSLVNFEKFSRTATLQSTCEWLLSFQLSQKIIHVFLFIQVS